MTQEVEAARNEDKKQGPWAVSLAQLWAFAVVALPMIPAMALLGTIDLAYHVRAGELMLHTHSLIRTDGFSFTAAGRPWLDHQWLAQILLSVIFRVLGWRALGLFQMLLVGAVFGLLYLACRSAGAVPMRAAVLTLAAVPVAFTTLTLRPQLLATVLFALSLWLVAGRRRHPGRLGAMPVIVAVWANVHGSFFLGPVLLGLAWVQERWERSPSSGRTLALTAISAAAAIVNPFGLRVWSYALGISTNSVIRNLVVEWQPPNIRHVDDLLFFLSVAGVIAILARREERTPWPTLLSLGVFFLIALTATRNVLWWALAVPPLLAPLLGQPPHKESAELPPSTLNTAIAGALVLLVAAFYLVSMEGASRNVPGARVADAPRAITLQLGRVLRPGERMFNAQRWGSWFELALPTRRVFVDSRIEIYPIAVWNDYLQVSAGRQGWQQILDRWHVDVVVASRGQQAGLIPLIRNDPGWRLAYQDKNGSIFARR